MKKVITGLFYVVVLFSLVLAACSPSPTAAPSPSTIPTSTTVTGSQTPSSTPTQTTVTPTGTVTNIKRGGVLKIINTSGSVTNIGNPGLLVTPADSVYNSPAVEMLIAPDNQGNLNPLLATSWDVNTDSNPPNIVFHLRKGVKFHDGTDFNAEAVKFNLDLARTGERKTNLSSITSVEVIDEYTVRVNLSTFDYTILTNLASSSVGWIVSPTAIQSHDKEWTTTHPVGTGPFKFVSYNRDVSVKFERFEDYWQEGKPYLDRVEFDIVADQMSGLLAFKSGAAQVLAAVQAKDADGLKGEGFTVIIAPASVVDLVPSSGDPKSPLSDLRVRQAIDYAIDKKAIASTLGYGYYEPANQPFVSTVWAYNPDVVGYPYNPAKARELLKEAGYPNGFKVPIWMVQGTSQDMQLAVQGYLAKVGIQAEIRPVTLPMLSNLAGTGWDGLLTLNIVYMIGVDPGQSLRNSFLAVGSTQVSVKKEQDVLDKMLATNAQIDPVKRKAMMHELVKMIVDQYDMVHFIYGATSISAKVPNLHDEGIGRYFHWSLADAWLEK